MSKIKITLEIDPKNLSDINVSANTLNEAHTLLCILAASAAISATNKFPLTDKIKAIADEFAPFAFQQKGGNNGN